MNDNNKFNLDGIFYDENGNFIPLTASHGNINGELSYLRNTYMEAEKEYFEKLLSYTDIREEFCNFLEGDSDFLFNMAVKLQEDLESGNLESKEELDKMKLMREEERDLYHMIKLEKTEGLMCLLFAAARDKVKILELIKTYEKSNKHEYEYEYERVRSR